MILIFQLFYEYIVFTPLNLFLGSLIIPMIAVLVLFFFVVIHGITVGVQYISATDELVYLSFLAAVASVFAVDGVNLSERPIDSC